MNTPNKPVSNQLCNEIGMLIDQAKQRSAVSINSEMVLLYWNIGKTIKTKLMNNERAEYGKQVVSEVSSQLQMQYGKGYSRRNLFKMIQFYEYFPEKQIVPTLSAQLSWSHFVEIIQIDDPLKREYYATLCANEHWSVRQLSERVGSMLFERTALSKKPELTIKNDLEKLRSENKMSVDIFLKDPYILDFLELKDTYSENDLENAILAQLQQFILEMGSDFAFLARQKRITFDNEDYYIDLLFFHRKMRRLVAIDLKLDKFRHEHKSQMEFYLKWLAKFEKQDYEENPIGLILCAKKSDEMVELLEMDKQGIHVSEYFTQLPPKEIWMTKLRQSVNNAQRLLDNKPSI